MKKLIWLALGLLPGAAAADEMVIYRCTGSSDVPVVQRVPCAAGMKQSIVTLPGSAQPASAAAPEPVAPAPPQAAAEPAATATPPTNTPEPPRAGQERIISEAYMVERDGGDAILDSALLPRPGDATVDNDAPPKPPLPPIFQCLDSQGGQYLHEYEAAPGRCELMNINGLGGATPVNAASCEVVSDRCTEVAEAQRCGSWQQRFRTARGRERFASAENRDAARAERERLQEVLTASDCRVPE
ncbi:hypothetical protein C1924_17685 [Stenotrophomonas sp. ESTM1D_MKCIP4_1]|uniref:hypothetical protein n=1 Tax=Stenotrophomonas sp. ESTM1D_MKCIP4_1 TaxID=2072414 RepID=UPI000D53EEC2|nr:hypothetical protein [Stenotrophomonas sp. ESTM1D_MKCIP4_1]AWH54882.1 hypothetical protein C1924_17685 [Stenotrophomonas sp. ESTM1D_MKCIP4_1]